ncbi:MAG: phosphate acyltransferase PlsX [Armatimonadetes bacterium]|nr:phosphate acyltransferase PlsX [Armatimonadota bacterium]
MRIAVDAMGGDNAPHQVVTGCLLAAARYPDTELVLVGDREALEGLLDGSPRPHNVSVHHASETIGMGDDPAHAVRRKQDSSLCVACRMVADGEAQAVFSAGNTGAFAAAATLGIGRIPGVHRACIAAVLPTAGGRAVVVDAGACVDCRPEWVVQFGIMGALYAEEVEGIAGPRVGLLNIGEEPSKGNSLTKAAHDLLRNCQLDFRGNVDGKDVFRGGVDVIACDGFWGNLLLKSSEGAAEFFFSLAREAITSTFWGRVGGLLVRPSLRQMKRRVDYAEYGGAFLLGVRGLVVIGHGRSGERAVVSALERAREGISHDLVARMQTRFAGGEEDAA